MLIVPLEQGRADADVPEVSAQTDGDTTVWALPAGDGVVTFATSLDACTVRE